MKDTFLYSMKYMCHFERPGIIEIMNLDVIVSLIFFEQRYLSYCSSY